MEGPLGSGSCLMHPFVVVVVHGALNIENNFVLFSLDDLGDQFRPMTWPGVHNLGFEKYLL